MGGEGKGRSGERRHGGRKGAPQSAGGGGPVGGAVGRPGLPRRVVVGLLVGLAGASLAAWGALRAFGTGEGTRGPGAEVVLLPPPSFAAAAKVASGDFVGAEACADCHSSEYEAWARSTHGRAGGDPGPGLLVAPFDGVPVPFRDGVMIPRVVAGRHEIAVRQEGRAEVVYEVEGVVGGAHMLGGGTQGFLSRLADGTVRFLPLDWSGTDGVWFCNTATRLDGGWLPITPDMAMADCGDWPPVRALGTVDRFADCQACHGSQILTELVPGEGYRTTWTSLAVNCESCHGPAREHVELARAGGFGESADTRIRGLSGLDKDASLQVCFACHALKDVLQEGWLPGDPLESYYALKFPALGDRPWFPDGRVRTFAYQATHLVSACYLDGPMDCVSCHQPHGQGYWDVYRRPLADPFDDRQCTVCHASKEVEPEAHTFHPPASEGARCVACHMPYLQHPDVGPEGVSFARSDHTIPVPRPAFDRALGVADACGLCHVDRSVAELQAQVDAWWGEIRPHRPLVAALVEGVDGAAVREAAERLLRPDQHDPLPQFQALGLFLVNHLSPDDGRGDALVEELLRGLAESRDLDVRALSLAALHWWRGDAPSTRRYLAEALERAGAQEEALRRRWTLALGFLGDHWSERGDFARSRAGYRKALEVLPDDPRVLASQGVMHNRAGEFAAAAAALRRSLAVAPDRPLTWVNLGIALGGMGDAGGASEAYRQALARNPHEPLAHFNLGNAHLRADREAQALEAYLRAVEADPGLGRAHYLAGFLLGRQGRFGEALPHARRAVEFEPDHEAALEMLRELERLVGEGQGS